MDTPTLVNATSAVTLLASEAIKGVAGEAGKDAWKKVKTLFGWHEEPEVHQVPALTAAALQDRPDLLVPLQELLKVSGNIVAAQLVGTIHAEKVVVANYIHELNM